MKKHFSLVLGVSVFGVMIASAKHCSPETTVSFLHTTQWSNKKIQQAWGSAMSSFSVKREYKTRWVFLVPVVPTFAQPAGLTDRIRIASYNPKSHYGTQHVPGTVSGIQIRAPS
jgi:hypothetical protein